MHSASPPSRRRSSCAASSPRPGSSAWARSSRARSRAARDANVEIAVSDGDDPRGPARPSQARHGDGPLRARRASDADARRRRVDEPPRDRGDRRLVRARADRAFRGARTAATATRSSATSPTAPPRCACRKHGSMPHAAGSRSTVCLHSWSDPDRRRSRARAELAEPPRAGQAPPAGREHRLRAPLRRRATRRGSGSSPSATRTASGAT